MIAAIIIGAIAGFLAGKILFGEGFGIIGNIIIGIVGGFIGRFLFGLLGFGISGTIADIISATVGAIILMFILGKVKEKKG